MEYSYNQTERQEELAFKKMCKQMERDKMNAMRENQPLTDKDREAQEVYDRLKALERSEGK